MQQFRVVVVVLLLCILWCGFLAGSSYSGHQALEDVGMNYAAVAAASAVQQEGLAGTELGQSLWVDAVPTAGTRQEAKASSRYAQQPPQYAELSVADAEAILQHAIDAAGQNDSEEGADESDDGDDEAAVQPPYMVYLSSPAADAAEAALGSAIDAASMQFVATSSPAELQALQQTPAPPYVVQVHAAPLAMHGQDVAQSTAAAAAGHEAVAGYVPPPAAPVMSGAPPAYDSDTDPVVLTSRETTELKVSLQSAEMQLPDLDVAEVLHVLTPPAPPYHIPEGAVQPPAPPALRQRQQHEAEEQQQQWQQEDRQLHEQLAQLAQWSEHQQQQRQKDPDKQLGQQLAHLEQWQQQHRWQQADRQLGQQLSHLEQLQQQQQQMQSQFQRGQQQSVWQGQSVWQQQSAQQQQPPQQQEQERVVPASTLGKSSWKGHQKGAGLPAEPQVPPATDLAPAPYCDPHMGLQPTEGGGCICMPGFGTNLDMHTCARCPVGWYSRGGQVGVAFCRPCPQLSISNPARTACVQRQNVIRPNVPASLCEPCKLPNKPFDPPQCCPKGQMCCGDFGCCPTKRCINNATTGGKYQCCGDDCYTGGVLNCCNTDQICVNTTSSAGSQICCAPARVCGQQNSKSCCDPNQVCCNNRDCCSVDSGQQNCAANVVNGPPQNQRKCCLANQVNCNITCCTAVPASLGAPTPQQCIVNPSGLAVCCDTPNVCRSPDQVTSCCDGSNGFVCQTNFTSSGSPVRRCCLAGYPLCPKNNFQPVCCPPGKCPAPDTADNCLP